jgi:signal transduction histidine kinase
MGQKFLDSAGGTICVGGGKPSMAAEPTVFVVDDDRGVRNSLQSLATAAGLAVETYASGREFLAAYDSGRAGCLLLDGSLRDSNGLDVQQELRRRHAALPVIVLTGHASVYNTVRAFKAGAIDFLEKPVPPEALLERIRAAIDIDQQTREAALEANFVASLSHELRTPLQGILGYHELLLDGEYGPLTSQQIEILTRVKKNAESVLDLVKATLELSCLQVKTMQLQLAEINMDEFIDEMAAEVRALHRNPNVAVVWYVAPDLRVLRSDPVKLKIVLSNLVTNAIKFTEQGRVTIAVQRDAGSVEFCVSDTGPGIPPEAREIIFEPFRRAEPASRRQVEGVGLGLYLVRRLVERFGGRITVDSEVGCGSCFRVWIPLDGQLQATDIA